MGSAQWKVSWDAMSQDGPPATWRVGIKESKLAFYRNRGHVTKLARVLLIPDVVASPLVIVKGWDRPEKNGCFVYVGKPNKDLRGGDASIEAGPPPGQFFLVFTLPDGTIDEWNWRPASQSDPLMPDGINGEILWPKQTS
jgi:hypothetical protein